MKSTAEHHLSGYPVNTDIIITLLNRDGICVTMIDDCILAYCFVPIICQNKCYCVILYWYWL